MPSPVASDPHPRSHAFPGRPVFAHSAQAPGLVPIVQEHRSRLAGLDMLRVELANQSRWRHRCELDVVVLVRGGVTLFDGERCAWFTQPRALCVPAGHVLDVAAIAGPADLSIFELPADMHLGNTRVGQIDINPAALLAITTLGRRRHGRARHLLRLLGRQTPRSLDFVEPGPRNARNSADRHARLVFDAQELLVREYNQNVTVPDLAARLNSSPFHLARLFRRSTGSSIHEFRHALRMGAALNRLQDARGDLAEVALDLGFSSHSHFSAAFRTYFGRAPSLCLRRASDAARAA